MQTTTERRFGAAKEDVPLLQMVGISKSFGQVEVLQGIDLTCTAAETGNVSAPDAGLAAPTLTASLDSENTLQTGQPGETEPSSDPDMAGCSMTRTPTPTSEIWTLLGGALLGLGARRRRRMHPHS